MCLAVIQMKLWAAEGLEDGVDLGLLPPEVDLGRSCLQQRNRSYLHLLRTQDKVEERVGSWRKSQEEKSNPRPGQGFI